MANAEHNPKGYDMKIEMIKTETHGGITYELYWNGDTAQVRLFDADAVADGLTAEQATYILRKYANPDQADYEYTAAVKAAADDRAITRSDFAAAKRNAGIA